MAKKKAARKKTPAPGRRKKAATKKAAPGKRSVKKKATKQPPARKSARPAPKEQPPPTTPGTDKEQYQRHKQRTAKDQRRKSRSGREIAPSLRSARESIDTERRDKCRTDFRLFCETYFPDFFDLGWSPAHLKVIARIETAVLKGGLFAVAMPRGSGKTTLSICAVVWAIVFGHRRSVVLFGATKDAAVELMVIIKAILEGEGYPDFEQDFPDVCVPCSELEDKSIMTKGQLFDGQLTRMKWDADKVMLPSIEGSPSFGSCIRTRGLGGHMRGLIHKAGTEMVRPDLIILDDPQTDESAMSKEETKKRYKTIDKGVRGLAGPGKRIAGIMPCTVIEPDDLADKILKGAPGWASERITMLEDFDGIPEENADRWEELRELYMQEMNSDAYPLTNAYFEEHQEEMEAGLNHYWPARVEEGFVSAIQHAMCWYMTRPESFWSEGQQNPQGDDDPDADLLSIDEIQQKQHNQPEGVVPDDAETLVSFIDVQHSILFYCVLAFNRKKFTGYVVEYGAWPNQRTRNFHMSQARPRLADMYKGRRGARLGLENVIRRGLTDCITDLFSGRFQTSDGQLVQMARCAVDCSDGKLSDHLREVIAELENPLVFAAFGRDSELTGKPHTGDRSGDRWRARNDKRFKIRKFTYQPNHWKSFAHARLATDFGERGSVSLFQDEPYRHKTFAEHLRSEKRTIERVKTVDGDEVRSKWTNPPGGQNHWFDCFVGCHVLAAHEGCELWKRASTTPRRKLKLSELRRQRKAT